MDVGGKDAEDSEADENVENVEHGELQSLQRGGDVSPQDRKASMWNRVERYQENIRAGRTAADNSIPRTNRGWWARQGSNYQGNLANYRRFDQQRYQPP